MPDARQDEEYGIPEAVDIVSDVADHLQAETEKAELQEQNLHLQKAESIERMTGAIANIFNNQLHVVTGYLGMVLGELPPNDSHAEKLSKALEAAKKASEVGGLLTSSLGQIQGKPEKLDLAELCLTNLPVFQAGKPKDIVIDADLPLPGPAIRANAKQIQQMLANIMINAWESIGDCKGEIRLKVKTVPLSEIPQDHRFPSDWQPKMQLYACLEVIDSGCGIHEKDIEKLFAPFFSTKPTGMGLGLSVILGIVKAHDSVITVGKGLSGGSAFRVFFPLKSEMTPEKPGSPAKVQEKIRRGTVLIVEDEDGVRRITELALVRAGFNVLQAKDGIEAIEIFEKHKDEISCLLCDLSMPRMGGWDTLTTLRSMRPGLPAILASGYDEDSGVMVGDHPELPDYYLTKPYDLHSLADMIGKAIARKKE